MLFLCYAEADCLCGDVKAEKGKYCYEELISSAPGVIKAVSCSRTKYEDSTITEEIEREREPWGRRERERDYRWDAAAGILMPSFRQNLLHCLCKQDQTAHDGAKPDPKSAPSLSTMS